MKYEVCDLTGELLDAAVAMAEGDEKPWGLRFGPKHPNRAMRGGLLIGRWTRAEAETRGPSFEPFIAPYSTSWAIGGPLKERERISSGPSQCNQGSDDAFYAMKIDVKGYVVSAMHYGPTELVAAMRCHVASKLGDEVDLP